MDIIRKGLGKVLTTGVGKGPRSKGTDVNWAVAYKRWCWLATLRELYSKYCGLSNVNVFRIIRHRIWDSARIAINIGGLQELRLQMGDVIVYKQQL